ncbi:MAG: hypothetical protein MCSN_0910 [Candidatus Microsyncoccus archaeolyticus]|nr:MAG: hypothetical protein MCSN_0910 [Candidatus Parcubacteria bacterium]
MEEKQIQEIIEIAFKEGIEKALKIVKDLNDPYLLDEFHDRLLEEINKRK